MNSPDVQSLSRAEWQERVKTHRSRLLPFLESHRARQAEGSAHPVYDFLFSYYSFSGGQLLRWTPGIHWRVQVDSYDTLEWPDHSRVKDGYLYLDLRSFQERRLPFLRWAITFLDATLKRPPVFHCFGLHEWAMLYRSSERLYPGIPLRVQQSEIDQTIEELPIRCTHYDAFRFFTPEARPLNRHQPGQKTVTEFDQPGCIHAMMDLYRLAYKIAPFVDSELLADLFFLAKDAREIDMKASPYDLSAYGFEPIPVETKSGREIYVEQQKRLAETGLIFRAKLLGVYRELLRRLTH